MYSVLSILAGILTIIEVILLSHKSLEGWIVASVAQVLWIYHFSKRMDVVGLVIAIVLLIVDLYGLFQWLQ